MIHRNWMLYVIVAITLTVPQQAQPQQSVENWTGDGGKGMSITILAPRAIGLAENQSHLPALVQSEFVNNFSSYSAIQVLDWERLDEIYLNLLSDKYDDKAREGVDLGNLAHTTHTMGGSIAKTPTGYNLKMNITKTADKMIAASFTKTFTYWELDNLTGIRQASLELLPKVGVTLTEKARQELAGAAAANHVTAQTALARGITAQRQGTEVAALSYYFQAAAFDPSLREAANRSSILNANILGGNMGDNVRGDIQWRKQWVERLTETEKFFDNFNRMESMPYTLFYVPDIKQGAINYQNETVSMSIETYLYGSGIWTTSIERALQAVYDGLNATGRKDTWQLGNWPQHSVTDLKAFAEQRKNFSVAFELVNNQNKVIGRQTLQAGGSWGLNWSGRPSVVISPPDRKTLNFSNVNANEITDNLTIRVANVNGTDAEIAAINGALQIQTITRDEVIVNDKFQFAKGEIQGFTNWGSEVTGFVIPNTIWGDPVISISNGAFRREKLNIITIGANMGMGPNSFRDDFKQNYERLGKKAGTYNISPTKERWWVFFETREEAEAKAKEWAEEEQKKKQEELRERARKREAEQRAREAERRAREQWARCMEGCRTGVHKGYPTQISRCQQHRCGSGK